MSNQSNTQDRSKRTRQRDVGRPAGHSTPQRVEQKQPTAFGERQPTVMAIAPRDGAMRFHAVPVRTAELDALSPWHRDWLASYHQRLRHGGHASVPTKLELPRRESVTADDLAAAIAAVAHREEELKRAEADGPEVLRRLLGHFGIMLPASHTPRASDRTTARNELGAWMRSAALKLGLPPSYVAVKDAAHMWRADHKSPDDLSVALRQKVERMFDGMQRPPGVELELSAVSRIAPVDPHMSGRRVADAIYGNKRVGVVWTARCSAIGNALALVVWAE